MCEKAEWRPLSVLKGTDFGRHCRKSTRMRMGNVIFTTA